MISQFTPNTDPMLLGPRAQLIFAIAHPIAPFRTGFKSSNSGCAGRKCCISARRVSVLRVLFSFSQNSRKPSSE
eukprot:1097640-Rhodomonas_salina.1